MELFFLIAAFVTGFLALKCKLPPLVGFLVAGFALHAFGFNSSDTLVTFADLGVTLLLFTIGLKLNIKTLLAKEIWASATIHNLLSTAFFFVALLSFKILGITMMADLHVGQLLLLGFSLSFSSTVFAVKSLQEKGEMNATYGSIAIGILVMQDIFAVIFLTVSTGKTPELTALILFTLPLFRPIFYKLLDWVGHGEMLVLYGIFIALIAGAGLFELVGMKPDLGALVLGMLLAGHSKASELSKSLFNLKEMFLVCFFLNIGLSATPTLSGFIMAIILLLLLPIKGVLYYLVLNGFKFRVRTSLLTSLTLFNYSEFGLIVGGLAYKLGWLPADSLVAIAMAVSLSFILSAPLNRFGHEIYLKSMNWLKEQSDEKLNAKDQRICSGSSSILILGMGRIGTGAYDELQKQYGDTILGIELVESAAIRHRDEGRNVISGDATDPDFWERMIDTSKIKIILLSMPNHKGNEFALELLNKHNYQGQIAAIASYPDQVEALKEQGVDAAFNIYNEAGIGFARHVTEHLNPKL
ncbi:cation:proton antiporter [Aliivibrio kagoshimensis]|uniref:cation:proton antiporter domain-containing protein n=1 Tax=Aliivibrio kagoshimensis TaxID=2910230 RepID=UPI003D11025D